MPAQSGRELLLKIDAASNGTFETVAGMRSRQITLNSTTVDVTHSGSTGRWRELLPSTGVRHAQITGSGIFIDEASDASVRQIFTDGTIVPWQIIVPNFGNFSGPFQIINLTYSGSYNEQVAFSLRIDSAGAITFTAAS